MSKEYTPFKAQYLHAHDRCEIFCVYSGEGYYITEGTRHKFESGKIILMRSGETHMPELTGTQPYERMALHFHPSILDSIDPEHRLLRPFFDRPLGKCNVYDRSAAASTGIYDIFSKMTIQSDDVYNNCLHVTSLLFSALIELNKLFDEEKYLITQPESENMQQIIDYVNQNLTAELSVELLCSKFFTSRSHLNRHFKRITGSTVWDYILTKRLTLTRSYISSGMKASEAAEAAGFGDYSSFYRAYVRKYNESPTGTSIPQNRRH